MRVLCVCADRAARVPGSPEWTGSGESTSQCSGSSAIPQWPSIPRSMTLGLRRRDVDQVAHAFHVRLAGEHPEVAHEDVADRAPSLDLVLVLDLADDRVRPTDRHADQLGFGLVERDLGVARVRRQGWRSPPCHPSSKSSSTIGMSALSFTSRW